MVDPPSYPDRAESADAGSDNGQRGIGRSVRPKVVLLCVVVLVVAFVVLHLTGVLGLEH